MKILEVTTEQTIVFDYNKKRYVCNRTSKLGKMGIRYHFECMTDRNPVSSKLSLRMLKVLRNKVEPSILCR